MNEFKIGTRENVTAYRPGDEIAGAAAWRLDKRVDWIEVRLFWHTDGKGTQDVEVVETVRFDQPQLEEARSFRFTAPGFPHSFSGKLISLVWSLEIVPASGDDSARVDLVISPTGQEIQLHRDEGT